jgi:hypothetical protein
VLLCTSSYFFVLLLPVLHSADCCELHCWPQLQGGDRKVGNFWVYWNVLKHTDTITKCAVACPTEETTCAFWEFKNLRIWKYQLVQCSAVWRTWTWIDCVRKLYILVTSCGFRVFLSKYPCGMENPIFAH